MKTILILAIGLVLVTAARAADNPLSFADGKIVVDVQERLRLETDNNMYDFNSSLDSATDQTYWLQRFRLGALGQPVEWVKLYAQGQDSRAIDTKTDNVPFVLGSGGDDPFDLRQAYVEIGNPRQCPWSLKVGRQELKYGDERLIGISDWNNFSRTFDAVKLRYNALANKVYADVFAGHVVTIQGTGPQGNYGENFNDSDWNDTLVGLYAGTTQVPFQTTEAYLIYRNKTDNGPVYSNNNGNTARPDDIKQEIYTAGLRLQSTPGQLHGFDYGLEGAYQWGRDAGRLSNSFPNANGVMLSHAAFAAAAKAGYTWATTAWKPRLGVEYDVASGDQNPNDHTDQSFLNLFPTNHKFYGAMDLFAWKNVHDVSGQVKCTPYQSPTVAWRNLVVQAGYHAFWLFTNEDAWYRANAVSAVRPLNTAALDANTFVGTELDLNVAYQPIQWVKLQAGYSHFFHGNYITDTAAGTAGSNDADFGYLQTVITF